MSKPSGQMVPVDQARKGIERLFSVNSTALVKSAPRAGGDPARLIRVAFNTIVANPNLRDCTHASLLAGVMEALKLGLTIGGPLQESWLLPFNVKSGGTYRKEATFVIGYQGYRNLADRAKSVMDMQPHLVFVNDYFDAELSEARVTHKPWWMEGKPEPGEKLAVYCLVHLRGGGRQLTLLPRVEVEKHRSRSPSYRRNEGPWVTDEDAMWLKTAIRVSAKYIPKASEVMASLARALELEDRADRGESQWSDFDLEAQGLKVLDESTQPPPKALDALKGAMAGSTASLPSDPPQTDPPRPGADDPPAPGSPMTEEEADEAAEVIRGLFEQD